MKTYKLFIQEYNIMENEYITREEIIKTNDIYHEIGKIYCQSLVKIKRIDYLDITKDLEQEIERLNNIINDIDKYIHLWDIKEIGEKTMLILNDILLIKNGMRNEVVRLKDSDKE